MTRTRLRIRDRYRLTVLRKSRPPFCSRVTGRTSFMPECVIWF